jgi:hypothetical protein
MAGWSGILEELKKARELWLVAGNGYGDGDYYGDGDTAGRGSLANRAAFLRAYNALEAAFKRETRPRRVRERARE